MNKKIFCMLLLAIATQTVSAATNGQEPLIVSDGQEINTVGRLSFETTPYVRNGLVDEKKILVLTPSTYIITRQGQKFTEPFELSISDKNNQEAVSKLSGLSVDVRCTVHLPRISSPIGRPSCTLQHIAAHKDEAYQQKPSVPGGNWFLSVHGFLLKYELEHCLDYKNAGRQDLESLCVTRTMNAHDYLLDRAKLSRLPAEGWGFCSDYIERFGFVIGAKCITAAELACVIGNDGKIANWGSCSRVMTSDAWISNPSAAAMTFDRPPRSLTN